MQRQSCRQAYLAPGAYGEAHSQLSVVRPGWDSHYEGSHGVVAERASTAFRVGTRRRNHVNVDEKPIYWRVGHPRKGFCHSPSKCSRESLRILYAAAFTSEVPLPALFRSNLRTVARVQRTGVHPLYLLPPVFQVRPAQYPQTAEDYFTKYFGYRTNAFRQRASAGHRTPSDTAPGGAVDFCSRLRNAFRCRIPDTYG